MIKKDNFHHNIFNKLTKLNKLKNKKANNRMIKLKMMNKYFRKFNKQKNLIKSKGRIHKI